MIILREQQVLFSPIFLRSCFPYSIFCMIGEGTHSTNQRRHTYVRQQRSSGSWLQH